MEFTVKCVARLFSQSRRIKERITTKSNYFYLVPARSWVVIWQNGVLHECIWISSYDSKFLNAKKNMYIDKNCNNVYSSGCWIRIWCLTALIYSNRWIKGQHEHFPKTDADTCYPFLLKLNKKCWWLCEDIVNVSGSEGEITGPCSNSGRVTLSSVNVWINHISLLWFK